MSTTLSKPADIFLSYAMPDQATADKVNRAFSVEGFSVFCASDIEKGGDILRSVRTPLVESRAVIAIVNRGVDLPSSMLLELGAAIAWQKPIVVLLDGVSPSEVPQFMHQFRMLPIDKLSDVVSLIQRSSDHLNEDERTILSELYSAFGVPVDQLLTKPASLDELASQFNHSTNTGRTGELLAYELLAMRKRGKLPNLRRPKKSAQ